MVAWCWMVKVRVGSLARNQFTKRKGATKSCWQVGQALTDMGEEEGGAAAGEGIRMYEPAIYIMASTYLPLNSVFYEIIPNFHH